MAGLLDMGVAVTEPPLFCFRCFLAVWCQLRRAAATLSLNMVGFMVEPIYSYDHNKRRKSSIVMMNCFSMHILIFMNKNIFITLLPVLQGHGVGESRSCTEFV